MNIHLTPWIAGKLSIVAAAMERIEADAKQRYPSESCGFVRGPAAEVALLDEAIVVPNEADRYHALDPIAFPRTSNTYFKIDELKAMRQFERSAAEGRPIKVIYHSHCDAGAYFSDEDAATFARDGELMWPCAFLVVSVYGGEVRDRQLWIYQASDRSFINSSLRVVAST